MYLVNQQDFDLIKRDKKTDFLTPIQINSSDSDEVKIKQHNDNFIRQQAEEKFREDRDWGKIEKRVKPILEVKNVDGTDSQTIDGIVEGLPQSFQSKGRQFLARLKKESNIEFDENRLYLEKTPFEYNVLDIVDELIRPRQNLKLNLDLLLRYLLKSNFPKSLIFNKEALAKMEPIFADDSIIAMSTPKNNRESTRKRLNESAASRVYHTSEDDTLLAESLKKSNSAKKKKSQAGNGGKSATWAKF